MRRPWSRLLSAAALLACGCRGGTRDTLLIGAAGDWTDSNTETIRQGIELAVEHANLHRLLGGRTLGVLPVDDDASGPGAVRAATQLVDDPRVIGVVGHIQSSAMVAAARVYDGHLVAVSASASAPELSGVSSWVFRTIPSDSASGASIARFAARLGRRAAVLYENDSYGRGLADAFRRHFQGRLVSIDPISGTPDDMSPIVSYYASIGHPDVVFAAGAERTGIKLLQEAHKQRLTAAFVGGDAWIPIVSDPTAAEGAYIGVAFDPSDPRPVAQEFVHAYRQKFKHDPDAYAALAYDATMVIALAATDGVGRREIQEQLAMLNARGGHKGVTGRIGFNGQGDPVGREIVMTQVKRGTLVVR